MKTIKIICAAIVMCTAMALIAMAGTNAYRNSADQTRTELPEIVPAIAVDLTALDRLFQ